MAALKLEMLKENAYVEDRVTLSKQGSTADIFQKMFRLFLFKLLRKTSLNYLNDWLEGVFICLARQIIIASAKQLSKFNKRVTVIAFQNTGKIS